MRCARISAPPEVDYGFARRTPRRDKSFLRRSTVLASNPHPAPPNPPPAARRREGAEEVEGAVAVEERGMARRRTGRRVEEAAAYFDAAILFSRESTLSPYDALSACFAKLRYFTASAFLPAAKEFTPSA